MVHPGAKSEMLLIGLLLIAFASYSTADESDGFTYNPLKFGSCLGTDLCKAAKCFFEKSGIMTSANGMVAKDQCDSYVKQMPSLAPKSLKTYVECVCNLAAGQPMDSCTSESMSGLWDSCKPDFAG